MLTGPTTYGQTKQGYIDYDRVVTTFPHYSAGQKEVEKRTKQLNDSLNLLVNKLNDLVSGEYPKSLTSDSSFRQKMHDKLDKIQNEMRDFQVHALAELKKLQDMVDKNLRGLVAKELKMFSSDNNLICVMDKKSILYCNDCKDFTDDFIAYYKMRRK
jgi:Skp family chaperone for outer membrane proteins